MAKVVIMDHPLIQHKIGFIRRKDTGTKDFRQTISEIAMLICYEATRDLKLDDVEIETLRSTDAGVAFYVESRGISCFHAGDLNDWKWDGAGDLVNGNMERAYRGQIRLLKNKKVNLAFIPMDSRQGSYQTLGMDYFLQNVDADLVFPMHMWKQYDLVERFVRLPSLGRLADKVVEIDRENVIYRIENE